MKSVSALRYLAINTKSPEPWQREICERAFLLWRKVWTEAFRDLKVEGHLWSDDFLDREMIAVCYENEPVGLMFERPFDLSRESSLAHSYFKNFPQQVMRKIHDLGHVKVIAGTYLTVSPDWRRKRNGDPDSNQTDLPISEILVGLCVRRFMDSEATAQISYSRNSHRVNEIRYRHGGFPLLSNVTAYNTAVDFIMTTKESAKQSPIPGVTEVVERLYSNRMSELDSRFETKRAA